MIYQKPTRTVTEAYTTADTDNGCRIICNSATAFEVTLHTATGRYNFDLEVDNIGAGAVTVSGQTVAQYGHAHIGCDGTSWIVTVSGGGSGGAVDSVNGETGTVVLDAADIDIADSGSHFTATDVEGALAELFTSVSNGKTAVAAAITDKGVTTSATDSFTTMATNIGSISGGGTYQSKTITPDAAGQTVTPDTGYDALSSVTINGDADLVAGNIKKDVDIFGVVGTYEGGGGSSYYPIVPDIILNPAENLAYSQSYNIYSADITGGQTYSAYSGTAASAFDNSTGTYWQSDGITTDEYIQVQLSTAKTAKLLSINNHARGINAFLLLGSNNGTDWTELYSGNAADSIQSLFLIENSTAFTYYRIKNNGTPHYSRYIRIYEIELMEYVSGGTI